MTSRMTRRKVMKETFFSQKERFSLNGVAHQQLHTTTTHPKPTSTTKEKSIEHHRQRSDDVFSFPTTKRPLRLVISTTDGDGNIGGSGGDSGDGGDGNGGSRKSIQRDER
ncbi:hypothetical protein M0802_010817 [Mischocyttarus mexicanus]|nr:hypothetical protein M0802_010817 [Mischocyttarus mexicanus]